MEKTKEKEQTIVGYGRERGMEVELQYGTKG